MNALSHRRQAVIHHVEHGHDIGAHGENPASVVELPSGADETGSQRRSDQHALGQKAGQAKLGEIGSLNRGH